MSVCRRSGMLAAAHQLYDIRTEATVLSPWRHTARITTRHQYVSRPCAETDISVLLQGLGVRDSLSLGGLEGSTVFGRQQRGLGCTLVVGLDGRGDSVGGEAGPVRVVAMISGGRQPVQQMPAAGHAVRAHCRLAERKYASENYYLLFIYLL